VACGVWLLCLGSYFIFIRPPLLRRTCAMRAPMMPSFSRAGRSAVG